MLPTTIATTDYHTGGEPFRIVAEPPVPIPGTTVAERRARAIDDPDIQALRAILCSEPRGHADMYGGLVVPPDDEGGLVVAPADGSAEVVVDVPSGRVTARVHREDGRVVAVDFVNVPSWVVARDVVVPTSRGDVTVTVAYGEVLWSSATPR